MTEELSVPYSLEVEHYHGDVLAISTRTPRISWKYKDKVTDSAEVELEITRSLPGKIEHKEMIRTQTINNVLFTWPLQPLESEEQVTIRIRLIDNGIFGEWSKTLHFEVGILEYWDLLGKFIGPSWFEGKTDHRHAPLIRTEFKLKAKPVYAKLYLSALGLVEGVVNGRKIGKDVLTPGWTCYNERLEVWPFNLTDELHEGKNTLGFFLGDGWYRGRFGFKGGKVNIYGNKLGLYAQLKIVYADGTTDEILSNADDGCWKATKGPIVSSDLCEGENYDARLEEPGWQQSEFDDSNWQAVSEVNFDTRKLEYPSSPAVRVAQVLRPVSIKKIGDHNGLTDWQIDLGQNCSQRLQVHIKHSLAGDTIKFQHAEVLESNGRLSTRPLRRGQQIDQYISNGKETYFEVKFAMHGFRYAEIHGWRGDLTKEDIVSHVYFSNMQRTGKLTTSNQLVNRLHDNALWSLRSNFVSLPTDCPQRDERLGWTGDISLFSNTAAYLYDVSGFLSNWLVDLRYEQKRLGTVPFYVPFIPLAEWTEPKAIAIWGDAAVRVPWSIYMETGDKKLLSQQYYAARDWIEEVEKYLSEDGVWDRKPDYSLGQLADWLDPTAPADNPVKAMTAKELVATAFYAKSLELFSRMSYELGFDTDKINQLYEHVRHGFLNRFFKNNGLMTSDTQCAYSLAIAFDLLDDRLDLKEAAGDRLASLVRSSNGKISTGFAGTPYVLPALTATGHVEEAYSLFLSDKCPSWMYQVKMGGTTTWERWDSMLPDKSVNPGVMTSFNHYALGSVAEWMHNTIGGLKPLTPGWHRFRIAPRPGGELTHAQAEYESPYGKIVVQWQVTNNELVVKGQIPFGTIAELDLEGQSIQKLRAGEFEKVVPLTN